MLISELTARVIMETGRPDLENLIESIAVSSIKQLHSTAKFLRDMVEETIAVPTPSPIVRLTLPPRFREFKDVAIVDSYGKPIATCEASSPSAFLGQVNKMPLRPSYYMSGNTYTVMSNRELLPILYLYVTYFQHPALENAGQSTWLLEQYPEVVVNYCNFKVHSKVGNDARSHESWKLYREGLETILIDQPAA